MYARKLTLEELKARSDDELDYSDIPPLDDYFWENAISMGPEDWIEAKKWDSFQDYYRHRQTLKKKQKSIDKVDKLMGL